MKTISELLEECPKSCEELETFYIDRMINSLDTIEESKRQQFIDFFKEKGVSKSDLSRYLEANPNLIFRHFDEKGYVMSLHYIDDNWWLYENGNALYDENEEQIITESREQGEIQALIYLLENNEKSLNKT